MDKLVHDFLKLSKVLKVLGLNGGHEMSQGFLA